MPISTPRWRGMTPWGSNDTMRSFQGGRPSIYTMTDAIRKVPTPALILCGDEDDNCIGPSLFLKQHLAAAGLSFFPKSGHVLNLEEPALFNEMVERFIALVEAGRWPVPVFVVHCERSEDNPSLLRSADLSERLLPSTSLPWGQTLRVCRRQ